MSNIAAAASAVAGPGPSASAYQSHNGKGGTLGYNSSSSTKTTGAGTGKIHNTAALATAYQELGKELSSSRLKAVGNYTLGRPIGEGTFGKVRMGYHRLIPNARVAIKQIPKVHSSSLTREIHHHRRLHHPHVMQLYEVIATESYIWMVSELCAGGELYDYLVEKGCLSEQEARRIFGQLCLAVAYVHDKGIVHRDLKLENVLLDERCNVKLGDFGFTREYEEKRLMDTFCGTTGYAAPEMLAGKKYVGKPVDVWSLGVILYALLCGALPFDDDDEDVMKDKILKGDFDLPNHLSEEAASLVSSILVKTPGDRPTIPEILSHPWFIKVMAPSSPGAMSTVDEDVSSAKDSDYFSQEKKAADTTTAGTSSILTASSSLLSNAALTSSTAPTTEETDGDSESAGASIGGAEDEDPASQAIDRRQAKKLPTPPISPTLPGIPQASGVSPAFLHNRNDSQATLRKQNSAGSDASLRRTLPPASSKPAQPLPTHLEGETSSPEESTDLEVNQTSLRRNISQTSSKGHHRTPSRSKRRSVSSIVLSDHHAPHLDSTPIDYLALLSLLQPSLFSTITEQNLLASLSMLGLDVGQVVHSVMNDACDASGALWWLLKKKSEEKQMLLGQLSKSNTMKNALNADPSTSKPQPLPPLPPKDKDGEAQKAKSQPTSTTDDAKDTLARVPAYPSKVKNGRDRTKSQTIPMPTSTSPDSEVRPPVAPGHRARSTSFSMRQITNVLAGISKDKLVEDDPPVTERSKSPVSMLLGKMVTSTGRRGSKDEETDQSASSEKAGLSAFTNEASTSTKAGRSPDRVMTNSVSYNSLSTVASSAMVSADTDSSKAKFRRSRFMSTVRTWLGSDDRVPDQELTKKRKPRKGKKGPDAPLLTPVQVGSVRRRSNAYSQASLRGRQAVPHSPMRSNVSRMSSSNSVYDRPSNFRRQSGSTILAHDGLGIHVRQPSRPSSIHSTQRGRAGSGLRGKTGSTSSAGSRREASSSVRHRRRASSEGGTIVQRQRVQQHSRRPSKASSSEFHPAMEGEEFPTAETPRAIPHRRSNESRDGSETHSSHASHSASYKTQFVAHRSRALRSPSRPYEMAEKQTRPPTWMRSWGKPPPQWTGEIDDEPSKSEILAALKPKLRDVFAQAEDDEWEDEDEEPNYMGGLGQPASSSLASWSFTSGSRVKGDSPYSSRILATPGIAEEVRPKSIRSLFQPPLLGSETAPKIISIDTTSDGLPANQGEAPGSTLAALSGAAGSRIRAAPAAFKLDSMQEEEEED